MQKKEEQNLEAQCFEQFQDPWQGTQEPHSPPYTKQGIITYQSFPPKQQISSTSTTDEIQHKT
jgi:hypothetical protein